MDKGKINELYQKAHREWHREYYSSVVDPTIKSVSVTRHFDYELFAELIVRECADFVDYRLTNPNGASMAWCDGSDIKEHFGVEE